MSSYQQITIRPDNGIAEKAEWLDDYFGNHNYGVRFPSDGAVFRADEYHWRKRLQDDVLQPFQKQADLTKQMTEKGSRFDHPMHEVSEENGKKVDITKHEDGRQDVKITVKRLDLKDPTPEDLKAEEAIMDKLNKTTVGVLVIYKPNNENIYFTCPLPRVRANVEMVIEKFREQTPQAKTEDFIIVESAVVLEKPKVTTLCE